MNTVINLGSSQIRDLSQILSRHLSRIPAGKEIIQQFESNKDQAQEALLAYLDANLPGDEWLTNQITSILGDQIGKQFTTVVAGGGSVGEILNISQLDELTIRYYVFSDVRQIFSLFIGVLIIGGMIASGVWWSRQPRKMTGDFNIAVAEFVQTGDEDPVAPILSQRIFSFLNGQYNQNNFSDVQVAHKNIGVIASAQEACFLAEKINAHLVIYGDVSVSQDDVLFTPQFYVIESHRSDVGEVNGEHKLSSRLKFSKEGLFDPSPQALQQMEKRTAILTEFTKALVFLAAGLPGDLKLARESIDQAIVQGDEYGDFEGKEILYLFGSDIARRQDDLSGAQAYVDTALNLNQNYGRGLIAQANIYYNAGNLDAAIETYKSALSLEGQPYGAYIQEKARLGIGNCCNLQFQYVLRVEGADSPNIANLANCALLNYQAVIASFKQQKKPELNLKEMAAWAYYGSGIVYQENGQFELAEDALVKALKLTNNLVLEEKARDRINQLTTK